jgi:outer membrane lipoprotein-sorting protein
MRKVFLLAALFFVHQLSAQTDKRAGAILEAMSNKYKTMTSFKVAFTYTNEGAKETLKGDATVRGTKFRLKMAGQEIFNDGKTVTTYIKETNEATVNNYDPKEIGDIDPTKV